MGLTALWRGGDVRAERGTQWDRDAQDGAVDALCTLACRVSFPACRMVIVALLNDWHTAMEGWWVKIGFVVDARWRELRMRGGMRLGIETLTQGCGAVVDAGSRKEWV